MKATDYISAFLYIQGVKQVFEVVGGMTTHLIDSLHRQGKIRIVSVHHEQAAAFAAEGNGRMRGVPGVAIATSGPGATNLLTGVGSCYFDSTPAVFITGQVNRNEQKGDRAIRQLGFQETDIVSIAKPITKAAWRVNSPEELPGLLKAAFVLALSGRPGPVLLDIPMDVQRGDIRESVPDARVEIDDGQVDPRLVEELLANLRNAQRPLILTGGGIGSAQARGLFRTLAEYVQVPVVNSLMAVDALAYDNPLRVGLIGSYGNRWANLAIGRADFLLVLGSRLDIRQTGSHVTAFKGDRTIYHVDCEAGEINNRITGCRPVLTHLRPFLAEAIRQAEQQTFVVRSAWMTEISDLRQTWQDTAEIRNVPGINPNALMHQVSQASAQAATFIVDVGQHQMWAAQSIELQADQRFLTSGGMGAMGFALPAALGAVTAYPDRPVMLIAGDGCFQVNIQELQTIVRNHLPVKMIILNNRCLGMVRQFQQSYFHELYPATYWGYSAPDFAQVAHAYGIAATTVTDSAELATGLEQLWRDPQAPFLLQVIIDTFANAYPKIAFGLPMTEMEPFAHPLDMEGT